MKATWRQARTSGALATAVSLYLALPFALFALGWLKLWLALPLVAVLGACLWLAARHGPKLWTPGFGRDTAWRLVVLVLIAAAWVLLAGVGRFAWQNDDHDVRNALFRILVEEPWPVLVENPPAALYDGPVALVYYIGFWLPPALAGKALGLAAGNAAQVLWAVLGVLLLCWLVLAAGVKKLRLWPLLVFIFFGGLDIVGCWLTGSFVNPFTSVLHLERWANPFQFSGFSTQLFWVYNQAIPAWLATLLLYLQTSNRALVLILALSALCSTLPVLGMLPVAAWVALRNLKAARTEALPEAAGKAAGASGTTGRAGRAAAYMKAALRSVLSFENLAGGGLVGMVSLLYLSANNAGRRVALRAELSPRNLLMWLAFFALEAGVYLALLWPRQKKNPLYWLVAACLALFPWLAVGNGGDFGMRGTIPALVLLYLMVIESLADFRDAKRQKHKLASALLCGPLCAG